MTVVEELIIKRYHNKEEEEVEGLPIEINLKLPVMNYLLENLKNYNREEMKDLASYHPWKANY